MIETLIEDVLRTVEREVGPIGLIARIEITRAVEVAVWHEQDERRYDGPDDDDDDHRDPEPDAPVPPDAGPAEKPDLYRLFKLKVLA